MDLSEDIGMAGAEEEEAQSPMQPVQELLTPENYRDPVQARRQKGDHDQRACTGAGHKVNRADFLLFERSPTPANKENQRLLNSF